MKESTPIRIAFFDTKPYDQEYFEAYRSSYGVELKYYPVKLSSDTARLAAGYQGVCAFANDEIDARTADLLWEQGITLIARTLCRIQQCGSQGCVGTDHVVRVPAIPPMQSLSIR